MVKTYIFAVVVFFSCVSVVGMNPGQECEDLFLPPVLLLSEEESDDLVSLANIVATIDPTGALQKGGLIRSGWWRGPQNVCPIVGCKIFECLDIAEHVEKEHPHFLPESHQKEIISDQGGASLPSRMWHGTESQPMEACEANELWQRLIKKRPYLAEILIEERCGLPCNGARIVKVAEKDVQRAEKTEERLKVAGKRKRDSNTAKNLRTIEVAVQYLQERCCHLLKKKWQGVNFGDGHTVFDSLQCPIEGCSDKKFGKRFTLYNHLVCAKHSDLFSGSSFDEIRKQHKKNERLRYARYQERLQQKKESIGENSYSSDL
jgi:hypothetical protein